MNLADVRTGISTRLQTITGLRVYDTVPEGAEPPCAVIALGAGQFDEDIDGTRAEWNVLVLISHADDQRAQDALDGYLSTSGGSSIPAAFRADSTLSSKVDTSRVIGWADPQTYSIANIDFVGVEITVETIG